MKARRIKSLARGLLDGSPAGRYNTRPLGGQVAQLVEQRTENPRVGGSIPPLATMKLLNFLELFIGPFWRERQVCQECGAPWKGAIPQWEVVPPGNFRSGR